MTRIMIVGEEKDFRDMLGWYLYKEGFETTTVKSELTFLQKIDEFKPDLIAIDAVKSAVIARNILHFLKKNKNQTKIILLTDERYSENEKEKINESTNGHIVDYIVKPFDITEFKERIAKDLLKK
jgi:DNA-binding response OmpR family regulator